jgi:hypothetical protein
MTELEEARLEGEIQYGSGRSESAAFQSFFGVPPRGGCPKWAAFLSGWSSSRDKERLLFAPQVKAFKEELALLCEKYGVQLSTGCGCCDGGLFFGNNNEFSEQI